MKNMVNRKAIVAGLLIVFAILAVVIVASTKNPTSASDITTPNAKSPPVTQPISEQTTVSTLILSDETNSITCQQPPTGNEYGGISGNENNSPKGTVIDPDLTIQYGRPTATGICGTYWYIAGWWFNVSEMAKLPAETLTYGVSPYAITSGDDSGSVVRSGNENSNDDNGENDDVGDEDSEPIVPVPEVATIVLVAFGIFTFVVWNRVKNK
jgi:hypothetical protein